MAGTGHGIVGLGSRLSRRGVRAHYVGICNIVGKLIKRREYHTTMLKALNCHMYMTKNER